MVCEISNQTAVCQFNSDQNILLIKRTPYDVSADASVSDESVFQ